MSVQYPHLEIKFFKNGEEYLPYINISETPYRIHIMLVLSETESQLLTMDDDIFVTTFDNNVRIKTEQEDTGTIIYTYPNIKGYKEGSATIKAYYKYNGNSLVASREVVAHNTFYKDNFIDIISDYDRMNMENNSFVYLLFKSCMEYLDILTAYLSDLNNINNPIDIKYKFLNTFGNSVGFGSMPYQNLFSEEVTVTRLYRELLNYLFDLLSIRGTRLSYELFFGALGYDIELLEYWFDADGKLIEIDPYDETASSYELIDLSNYMAGDIGLDPRYKMDYDGDTSKANKSFYIKPIITYKENFSGIISYSQEQRNVLRSYLEFLKPLHIKYLEDVLQVTLPQGLDNDHLYKLYENNHSVIIASLLNALIATEEAPTLNENIVIGYPLNIMDVLGYLPSYDSSYYYDGYVWDKENNRLTPEKPEDTDVPPEHWNDENWMGEDTYNLPSTNNLFYDIGTLLDELVPNTININEFQTQYSTLQAQGYSSSEIESSLMSLYSITAQQYLYLVNYQI